MFVVLRVAAYFSHIMSEVRCGCLVKKIEDKRRWHVEIVSLDKFVILCSFDVYESTETPTSGTSDTLSRFPRLQRCIDHK